MRGGSVHFMGTGYCFLPRSLVVHDQYCAGCDAAVLAGGHTKPSKNHRQIITEKANGNACSPQRQVFSCYDLRQSHSCVW